MLASVLGSPIASSTLDRGRGVTLLALLACACVGLPPGPPQQEGTTAAGGTTSTSTGDGTSLTSGDGTTSGVDDTSETDSSCGDGIVEAPEECDLGDLNGSGMYCTGECRNNACGDGYVGPGEACDDGNDSNEDLCTTECGLTSCGDGEVQRPEQCDEGTDNSPTGACLPSCLEASCGDQFIHEGVEVCDSDDIGSQSCENLGFSGGVLLCAGNCAEYDTSDCYACGDGVIDPGEACDGAQLGGVSCDDLAAPGETASGGVPACNASCTLSEGTCTFCGNGVREGTEECDGAQLGGTSCPRELGAGYGGGLVCNANCTLDTSMCCLTAGQLCTDDDQCCDGTCNAAGGTQC